MTDKDYIAISNTGKNITITMTPGMKQRILGDGDRIGLRFVRSANTVLLSGVAPSTGYKVFRRKNVWSMSMASKRLRFWPVHDRIVFALSHVHMNAVGAMITLPKPRASIPDKPIAAPVMRDAEAVIDGEVFHLKLDERDGERLKAAWLRREKKLSGASHFNGLDMVVAGITGACLGFMIAVLLAAAGVLS